MPRDHIPQLRHCLLLAMLFAALILTLRFGFLRAQPLAAAATTFTVTNTNDAGAGSLRQAIAISLDSVLLLTDPFPVVNNLNFSNDHRTRIMLFATGVKLGPGEDASNISAVAEDSQGGMHPLTVEFVGTVPSLNWLTEIVVKLPDGLTNANTALVSVTLHGSSSNKVRIGIKAP